MKYLKTFNEDYKETPQYSAEILKIVKELKLNYTFTEDNGKGYFEIVFGFDPNNEGSGKAKKDDRYKIVIKNSDNKPFWVYKGKNIVSKELKAKDAITIVDMNESSNKCERCDGDTNATTMSMFNTDMICTKCKEDETNHPDYSKAVKADIDEIKKGNYNFQGIGYKKVTESISTEGTKPENVYCICSGLTEIEEVFSSKESADKKCEQLEKEFFNSLPKRTKIAYEKRGMSTSRYVVKDLATVLSDIQRDIHDEYASQNPDY